VIVEIIVPGICDLAVENQVRNNQSQVDRWRMTLQEEANWHPPIVFTLLSLLKDIFGLGIGSAKGAFQDRADVSPFVQMREEIIPDQGKVVDAELVKAAGSARPRLAAKPSKSKIPPKIASERAAQRERREKKRQPRKAACLLFQRSPRLRVWSRPRPIAQN
jgi:hypothetical protein